MRISSHHRKYASGLGPWFREEKTDLLPIGMVPLVGVRRYHSSQGTERWEAMLWQLRLGGPRSNSPNLGSAWTQSWRAAQTALPRSLPVLWDSVASRAASLDFQFKPLTPSARRCDVLQGHSYGLGLALALASLCLDIGLPSDVIASATIDPEGRVGPVDHLACKLHLINTKAPGLRRVFVAKSQAEETQSLLGKGPVVVGVKSLEGACHELWPGLADQLIRLGEDPRSRSRIIHSLFRLAVDGQRRVADWRPIADTARLARESWPEVTPIEQIHLNLAEGIARRHEANQGIIEIPSDEWFALQPVTIRLAIVRNLLQQSSDTGRPDPVEIEARAVKELKGFEGLAAFPDHLKLRGALARFMETQGRFQEALRTQLELVKAWLDRLEPDTTSYNLGPAFRLSEALKEKDSFEQVERLYQQVRARCTLSETDLSYIMLPRARALTRFRNRTDAIGELDWLWETKHLDWPVRHTAARWLIAVGKTPEPLLSRLWHDRDEGDGKQQSSSARRVLALIDLDQAIACGRDAGKAIEILRALDPAILKSLESSNKGELAPYIARFHPYG
jgi:hypothetical protein